MNNTRHPILIYHARIIGLFFLLAFVAYGGGRYLIDTKAEHFLGYAMILINSIMVLFIGILFRKTLMLYNSLVADIYLFTRIFEAVALASITLTLFMNITIPKDYEYFLAMLILGLGSIPMCWTLYKHKLAPAWLALWGVIGYSIFSLGFLMELLGNKWSMFLLIVAALWEITFAFWLLISNGRRRSV